MQKKNNIARIKDIGLIKSIGPKKDIARNKDNALNKDIGSNRNNAQNKAIDARTLPPPLPPKKDIGGHCHKQDHWPK